MAYKFHWSRIVYRVTLLFLFLFKFIGLATFSISKRTTGKKNMLLFTVTKLGIFYNLFLSCLILLSNYITIPIVYNVKYPHRTIITTVIEIIQNVLGSLVIFSILLYYCTNRSVFIRIGNYLIHAESIQRQLRQSLIWKHVFYVLFIVYILNLSMFVALLITDHLSFNTGPLLWLKDIVPTFFVSWLFIQYFSVLAFMDAIFVNINYSVQELCRSWSDHSSFNSFYQTRRMFNSCSTIRVLVRIRGIHDYLCDISSEISQFYSFPTLIAVFFTFFTLLYNSYYLFEPFIVENMSMNSIVLANTLLWIIYILYPLGLLTSKITKITNEIEKTGNVVHALLNRTVDRETKGELEQFSLQLLHRKVKFTANGYFTLDNTFLQSMLGTTTTYIVILIQFQVGTSVPNIHPCNCTQ